MSSGLVVDKLVPGGQGIATLPDGKKIFLWNALPKEVVTEYEITKKKSKYCEGIATKIENPAPCRIEPVDGCYLSTSPWQVLDHEAELKYKIDLLAEVFRQHDIYDSVFFTTLKVKMNSDFYHYRNKMEYSLFWDNDEQKIKLAFHKRGTHRKIPIVKSSLERQEIFARAQEIVDDLNARGEEARKYQSLLLRTDRAGNVSGGLLENYKPHPIFPPLSDVLLGYKYTYSVTGFFQINLPVYELVLQEIAEYIRTEKVLDLYAGVGTIGLSVARGRELTLVEVNPLAYAELEKNCQNIDRFDSLPYSGRLQNQKSKALKGVDFSGLLRDTVPNRAINQSNHIPKITPVLAKSEEALDFIQPDQTVILDPPRAGCDIKLLEKLLLETPETIIYLSCNPATQARDLAILLAKYHIQKIQPYNFFPRTPHLENLVVLQRS